MVFIGVSSLAGVPNSPQGATNGIDASQGHSDMLELQQFVLQQMRLRLGAVTLAGTMRAFLPGARVVDERRWGGAEHGRTRACTSGWVRVFLPFALGYYLSYLLRTVNAVISPRLTDELGLSAASLGLLTSAYFLAFGAAQIPVGIALDRFGPRRVEAALLQIGRAHV